ncbi:hypothetical protein IEQ34_019869 [Dendrobium chrysotoxum]|uniref:Uncharacterized protein n=1 Tax=Dendrobium chrysotoxum TaxID=161865 RepID=A0AAV7G9U6_DENCH|nr:hypothetical protein IEQ34_019869 [Dendrobium chrysotoxum]
MGATCLNGKELDSNEKAATDSENDIEEFRQESGRDITALELEMEFEKMSTKLPLALDVLYGKRTNRCWLESCPCGSDVDLASIASLLNSLKNFGWHSLDSGEYKDYFSLNMFDKGLSLSNCPLKLRLSQFIFEDLIHQRKTRSLNDPGGVFSDRSVIDSISNVVLSHSGWWKLDAFQKNAKAISLFKRSIFTHLSILDDVINEPRSRSPSPMRRTLELSRSSVLVDNTSLQMSKSELTPKKASEVKFSKMKLISCSSSKSTFSCQSISSANSSITKGHLQCFQKGGMSCFTFSLDDAPQVIYMASPLKIESSAEKAIDGMYLFYFKDSKNSDCREHSMNSTSLIAKMKVSSSIILTPNRVKIMETEFVLYGSQGELSNKLQKSSSIVSGSKGFTRKVAEIFRPSNMAKIKPKDKVHEQNFDGLGDISESSPANDAFDVLLPNLELAAIVVRECFQDDTNDLMFGGWGLKFLEKAGHNNTSSEPSLPPCSTKNPSNKDESAKSMNVIIPADLHGGPVTQHGGPASIIARWRSGGHCDCGGWDIGCPLTVLNHSSIYSNASTKDTEKKPVNLFIEGTKNSGHPTLSMMKITEGLYSIYFQSSLSILQSFSIAVASIHKSC